MTLSLQHSDPRQGFLSRLGSGLGLRLQLWLRLGLRLRLGLGLGLGLGQASLSSLSFIVNSFTVLSCLVSLSFLVILSSDSLVTVL
jgi:hypothetical protein